MKRIQTTYIPTVLSPKS